MIFSGGSSALFMRKIMARRSALFLIIFCNVQALSVGYSFFFVFLLDSYYAYKNSK